MTVKIWDLKDPSNGKLVREFKVHEGHIFDVKFDVRRIIRCVVVNERNFSEADILTSKHVA